MKAKWIFKAVFGALFFAAAMGFATMWLWNGLAVELFAAPIITFWQAIGLLILGRLLTGGFGHRGGGWGEHWKNKYQMKAQMKERWGSMNEQERKDFMESWKKRNYCGPIGKEDKDGKPDIETAD